MRCKLTYGKLQQRDIGRLPRAAAISLNQYLDQWLTTAAKPMRLSHMELYLAD